MIANWAIAPLLVLGGLYLCFEGCEKLAHRFLHGHDEEPDISPAAKLVQEAKVTPIDVVKEWNEVDLVALEKEKIQGAIRTDFVLSAEIIVITLGSVQDASLTTKILVLVGIAIIMTVGVYGLVGTIVKLDDIGLYLVATRNGKESGRLRKGLGNLLIGFTPYLMRFLAIAGTVAMFLVGGGIVAHGIPAYHHFLESISEHVHSIPNVGGVLSPISMMVLQTISGLLAGFAVLMIVTTVGKFFKKQIAHPLRSI